MDIVRREQREAFVTVDGSTIRELAGTVADPAALERLRLYLNDDGRLEQTSS